MSFYLVIGVCRCPFRKICFPSDGYILAESDSEQTPLEQRCLTRRHFKCPTSQYLKQVERAEKERAIEFIEFN